MRILCNVFSFLLVLIAVAPLRGLPHQIAITFDDLPSIEDFSAKEQQEINGCILEALKANGIPSIGFVNEGRLFGKNWDRPGSEKYSTEETEGKIAVLKQWVEYGHPLANHTYSHYPLGSITLEEAIAATMRNTVISKKLMSDAGKESAYRYFRHPFFDTGDTREKRDAFEAFLASEGYAIAPATINTSDVSYAFKYNAAKTAEEQAVIKQTYLAFTHAMFAFSLDATLKIFGRPIKQIWLLHVTRLNALVINELIALARGFGFEFISLDEALTDAAYSTSDTYYAKLAPFQCAPAWLYRWDLAAKRVDWTSEPQTKTFGVGAAASGCCGVSV